MSHFQAKIKFIFLPFLAISAGFVLCYTLLDWLLIIRLHVFDIKDELVNVILPLGLPWIPILIWLMPRTKLIALNKGSDKPRFGLQAIAWLAMCGATMIAQAYLETATGKMTQLDNINTINNHEATKYYSLQNGYYIDKDHAGIYSSSKVSGKHNEDLTYCVHYVLPIFKDTADTIQQSCAAWLGVAYDKTIDNNLSDASKEERWKDFATATEQSFNEKDVHSFTYLQRTGNDDDRDRYLKALKESPKFNGSNNIILVAEQEAFEARNGNKLAWALAAFAGGALLFLLVLSFLKLDEVELDKRIAGQPTEEKGVKDFFSYVIPHKGFFITPILIDLNAIIFCIMMFKGLGFEHFPVDVLKDWGANYKPLTLQGQWWRLLTSIFLHDGLMHLATNMVGLMIIGIVLEPVMGKTKYAATYIVSGIVASAVSLYWHDDVVSVGASGAIFGMYGAFLAMVLTKRFPKELSKSFFVFSAIFIGFNLLMGLANGIDNAAHMGGLVSGFIIGLLLHRTIRPQTMEEMKELEREQMTDTAIAAADAREKEGQP